MTKVCPNCGSPIIVIIDKLFPDQYKCLKCKIVFPKD